MTKPVDGVMRRVALVLMALLSCTSAQAVEAVFAAGRIEYTDKPGSCSAALVRPNVIVTAAHCASGPEQPGNMHFRVGDGRAGDVYPIDLLVQHPLYDPESHRPAWKLRFDVAVARLRKPVPGARAQPFPSGDDATEGEKLFIVSWRKGEGDRPRQRACPVFSGISGLVTMGCRVRGGESGAPVLRKTDHGLELVAVISSRYNIREQPVAQASDIRLRLPPLLDLIDRADP